MNKSMKVTGIYLIDTPEGQSLPFHQYAPTLDRQPRPKHPMRVEYTYNNLDQLITETSYRTNKPGKQYYHTDYTYDPNGNVIAKSLTRSKDDDDEDNESETFTTTYEYDYSNLLKNITYPDGETNTFIHCRCGNFRHQKVDSQGLTSYLYDKENDVPIFETDEAFRPKARYIKGPWIDELISRTVYEYEDDDEDEEEGKDDDSSSVSIESKTYYYLQDGLGNVRQLVDEKGKVASEYDYLPFGEIIESKHGESKKNPFTFTGKPYDQDSGLYYNQARYNDSRIGRFTTVDPLLRQPRASVIPEHPYVYVANNPINYTDPTGLGLFAITIRKIEQYLAAGLDDMAAAEARPIYEFIVNSPATFPYPLATEFMRRWLEKVGGTRTLASGKMANLLGEGSIKENMASILGGSNLQEGSYELKDFLFDNITASGGDYFYALGFFDVTFTGCCQKEGRNVTLNGSFDLSDTYDWQNPGDKYVDLLGDRIYDRYGTLVENHGLALPFDVDGSWRGRQRYLLLIRPPGGRGGGR